MSSHKLLQAWSDGETAEAAEFFAVLNDATQSLDWLDRAVRSGDERAEFFRRDPLLANVRSHPRFQQILESIAYRRQQQKTLRDQAQQQDASTGRRER